MRFLQPVLRYKGLTGPSTSVTVRFPAHVLDLSPLKRRQACGRFHVWSGYYLIPSIRVQNLLLTSSGPVLDPVLAQSTYVSACSWPKGVPKVSKRVFLHPPPGSNSFVEGVHLGVALKVRNPARTCSQKHVWSDSFLADKQRAGRNHCFSDFGRVSSLRGCQRFQE